MSNQKPAKSESPTPAEWKTLRIVHGMESCAARDVVQAAAADFGWSASTTKTLLRRLVEKEHLQTERIGNSFLYSPTQSAIKMLCREADGLLANAVDNAVGPLLSYMVKKSRLSQSDLDELRTLLDEKEAGQ